MGGLDQRSRHSDQLPPAVLRGLARDPLAPSHRRRPESVIELVDAPERRHGKDPGRLEQHDAQHDERGTTDDLSHSPTLDVATRPDGPLAPSPDIRSIGTEV